MAQRPVAVGLFLCDQVILEEGTRNVTPVNCFVQHEMEQFPSGTFPFVVFAVLTDGMGEVPLQVIVQSLDNLDAIYRRSVSVRFTNPLQEIRCILRVRECTFPAAGFYQVILLADKMLIAQRRFRVFQKELPT